MLRYSTLLYILAVFFSSATLASSQGTDNKPPRVFVLNAKTMQERRNAVMNPKTAEQYERPVKRLVSDANKALQLEIAPVTSKTAAPPSGDKHDYMSQAPYFWKNPDTKTGFPYIRRDGERNPETLQYPDHEQMDEMVRKTETLSIAFYFTGNEVFAARAAEILRMWFLDPKTKMNPNLTYAQAIPGLNDGRGIGIIETHGLIRVVDSAGLLAGSKAWTKEDQSGLEGWFGKYVTWLMESKNGRAEAAEKNNHGTIYDAQVASFALFAGKTDIAKKLLESTKTNRIAKQVEPDGKQPLELERTKAWNYSTMNLGGFVELAQLGDSVGIDLWSYQTTDGRSIRKTFEFLFPFADGKKKWEYQQIEPLLGDRLYDQMRRAKDKYKDDKFKAELAAIPATSAEGRDLLLRF